MTETTMSPEWQTARRITRKLIRTLKAEGWTVVSVNDGGDIHRPRTEAEAMEVIFDVDCAWVRFAKPAPVETGRTSHSVMIIGSNGEDVISDWNSYPHDSDGFNALMEAFLDTL